MPGTRRFNDPEATTVKLTIMLPVDLDRQLRALAKCHGSKGIAVSALVRAWIIEKVDGKANR